MAGKGVVDPSKLPPSDTAAYLHILRTIYQATVWEKLGVSGIDPLKHGWTIVDGVHCPIRNTEECAPDELLKLIRCQAMKCSRRKN